MIARITTLVIILTFLFIGVYWSTRALPPTDQNVKLGQVKKNSTTNWMEQAALPKDPFSLLMIGVDQRKGDRGRTDALILLTINPRLQTIKVVHIPRDLKTKLILPSKRIVTDKINHAYALGDGIPSTIRTIEEFLKIPIHHYVKVNMKGFRAIIDAYGGVDIVGTREFSSRGHHFVKGKMHLNGDAALAYVRDRTESDDFDRHRRQQQVLYSLWDKAKSISTLAKVDELIRIGSNHLETSFTLTDIWRLQSLLRSIPKDNVETLRISGYDQWTDRYYFIVPESEQKRIQQQLRRHLEIES